MKYHLLLPSLHPHKARAHTLHKTIAVRDDDETRRDETRPDEIDSVTDGRPIGVSSSENERTNERSTPPSPISTMLEGVVILMMLVSIHLSAVTAIVALGVHLVVLSWWVPLLIPQAMLVKGFVERWGWDVAVRLA